MNIEEWQEQVFNCPNMNPTAVAICLAIGSHGHWSEDKTVWPSRQRIAGMVGTSRDNVGKYMTALEGQGWLKVVNIRKDNVREYELTKPEVVVVHGILAVRERGNSHTLKNQVVVSNDKQVVVNYDKQVAVVHGQVVVNYDKNLPRTYQENLQEELTSTSTVAGDGTLEEDESLGEVAMFNKVEQVDSYIKGVRYLSLTSEKKNQIRDLCLNPKWNVEESRPNFRTQAAIKEVLG